MAAFAEGHAGRIPERPGGETECRTGLATGLAANPAKPAYDSMIHGH
jgi:hypothetical protein